MRLVTYRDQEGTHVGALQGEQIVPLDSVAPDMLALIDGGDDALAAARAAAEAASDSVALADITLLAPIPRPRQNVICIGMNYVEHAYESLRAKGAELKLPAHPVFFTKPPRAVVGPDVDFVLDDAVTGQLDYEVELAFVIGKAAKNVSEADALNYVFGYTIINDMSARDLQNQHLQWFKGKSLDGSCPMGPCITTADEVDGSDLGIRLRLNGETRQDSRTNDLIFGIPTAIAVLSRGMTLEPGTVIATGTPSGVGMGMQPQVFLKPGDVVEAEIDGIGTLRTAIVAP